MRESLGSENAEEISAKTEALSAAMQKVSEQIYAAAQQEAASDGASDDGEPSADEEEVVDAEVVDEGEEK